MEEVLSLNNRENQLLTEAEIIAIKKGFKEIENGQTIRIQNINNIWESVDGKHYGDK